MWHQKSIRRMIVVGIGIIAIAALGAYVLYQRHYGSIRTVHSFRDINFDAIEAGALVVLDVDETLTQSVDAYIIREHTPEGDTFWKRFLAAHPGVRNWSDYMGIMLRDVERPLIEPEIVARVKQLQERGVNVIVCTSIDTQRLGMSENTAVWRYEQLRALGFAWSYADAIMELPCAKGRPLFYRGVLTSDPCTKGPLIGAFLDRMHLTPPRIVMIDDEPEFVTSVRDECVKRGIPFTGYVYKNVYAEKPWDEPLVTFQTEYLLRTKTWLSDARARELMAIAS